MNYDPAKCGKCSLCPTNSSASIIEGYTVHNPPCYKVREGGACEFSPNTPIRSAKNTCIAELKAENKALKALLRKIEWRQNLTLTGRLEERCPACFRLKEKGHLIDCPLHAAIKEEVAPCGQDIN
jgi:hypothetical protein